MDDAINTLASHHALLDAALCAGDVDAVLALVEAREALLADLGDAWQAASAATRERCQDALAALQRQERDLLRRCLQQRDAIQAQLAASAHRQGPMAAAATASLLDRQA